MESHQKALVDQAIRRALTCYDDRHRLLRSSDDARFRMPRESLAFAALLLTRAAEGRGRDTELGLARLLIDRVLELQNTTRRDPSRGEFPMLWSPDAARARITDPDSREIMGSLLGAMLKDHTHLLGQKRCQRVREAVKLSIRNPDQDAPRSTSAVMITAWLELEFGDRWRGERLATEVALAGLKELRERRFGDPGAFAQELWALGLWRRSERLHDGVAELLAAVMEDIDRFAHPNLPELLGSVTAGGSAKKSIFPWLGTWLTWHALSGEPMLPKQMTDPLQATLYAFPALARLRLDRVGDAAAGKDLERAVAHDRPCGSITGWWESDLHIEARMSGRPASSRHPVAGARWRTPGGNTVWLRCRVAGAQNAVCRKRFVHFDSPGSTVVSVHNMGPGETRMIENGWWLSGLHFAMEGYQMMDAERSPEGLELRLKPTSDKPMLMFSPLR